MAIRGEALRWEYRWFSGLSRAPFAEARRRGAALAADCSQETYLLLGGDRSHNVKLRGGRPEVKQLVARRFGLELWRPVDATAWLPGVANLGAAADRVLERLARAGEAVRTVPVRKWRRKHTADGCSVEQGLIWCCGWATLTGAIESAEPQAVRRLVSRWHGGRAAANLSYPAFLGLLMAQGLNAGRQGAQIMAAQRRRSAVPRAPLLTIR